MTKIRGTEIALLASAVAARIIYYALTGYTADDSYITFRYAENLASGLGFVYNAGERVLGTTTPLFTLLLSLFATLKISVPAAALIVSLASSGLTALLLFRFAQSLHFGRFDLLPALAYIIWPRSLMVDICGMETAFFTMLVLLAFYFQHQGRTLYAISAAALASGTRPEGFFLLGILMIYNLVVNRRDWWRVLLIPSALILPWVVFATIYFGSPVPNSIPAKLALYSHFGQRSAVESLVYVLGLHNPLGLLLMLAMPIGSYWLMRKQKFGTLELTWFIATVAFFVFSPTALTPWYVTPLSPIILLFALALLPFLEDRILLSQTRWRVLAATTTLLIHALLITYLCWNNLAPLTLQQRVYETTHREIGFYLNQQAKPIDIIAAEDIGYMGYYSQRHILDRDGLISPEAIPYNRTGRYWDLIRDYHPEWVVAMIASPMSTFLGETDFLRNYHEVKRFGEKNWQFVVCRRTDDVVGSLGKVDSGSKLSP